MLTISEWKHANNAERLLMADEVARDRLNMQIQGFVDMYVYFENFGKEHDAGALWAAEYRSIRWKLLKLAEDSVIDRDDAVTIASVLMFIGGDLTIEERKKESMIW